MNVGIKSFLQRWLISTLAVLVATYLPGIHYRSWIDLIVATLLLGILNTFLRPILMVLALPLVVLTLGLFMIVINAVLLLLVSMFLKPGFQVDGFGYAFLGAIVISIVTVLLNSMTGSGESRVQVKRGTPAPPPPRRDDGGSGPVIDV